MARATAAQAPMITVLYLTMPTPYQRCHRPITKRNGTVGIRRVSELIAVINDDADTRLPPEARIAMRAVADQLCDLQKRIKQIEQAIRAWHAAMKPAGVSPPSLESAVLPPRPLSPR